MKGYLKTALVLTLICAFAAVLLAVMNKITAPAIEEYEHSVVMDAYADVSCGYEVGEQTLSDGEEYVASYLPLKENGALKGYILNLVTSGYGGEMNLVASYSTDGIVLAVKMVSNSETPGVGKKSENEGYMDKYIGKGSSQNPVPVSKDMLSDSEAAMVSGASITFGGISRAVASGSDFAKKLGGKI